jgi:hypothetical protein
VLITPPGAAFFRAPKLGIGTRALGDTVSQSGHAGQSDNLPTLSNFSMLQLRGML